MSETLSIFLSVFSTGMVIFLFVLILWVIGNLIAEGITILRRRRPACYKTHEHKAHNAVLFRCDGCDYRKECWK